jgi:hypothetical protein
MTAGLEVSGELTILAGAVPLHVEFQGDVVSLELDDLRSARALGRILPQPKRRLWLDRLKQILDRAGLVLQIRIGHDEVARLGGNARPGRTARLLGLAPLQLHGRSLLLAFARRPGPRPVRKDTR